MGMVTEAEKYKSEDEQMKKKIEAKNTLENYAYQIRNTVSEPKLKDHISADDRSKVEQLSKDTITWLDDHQDETTEMYEEKYKELDEAVKPILTAAYQAAGGAGG